MSETNKEENPKPFSTKELLDFMEQVQSGFISIHSILEKFKEDHYEKQEENDILDDLLDEVQDTINEIGEML